MNQFEPASNIQSREDKHHSVMLLKKKFYTIDPRCLLKWLSGHYMHHWFHSKKVITWWWISQSCDNHKWIYPQAGGRYLSVCLQACCNFLHFVARYNSRHVTEKSSANAKSIELLRLASNLLLLRNLRQLLCKL